MISADEAAPPSTRPHEDNIILKFNISVTLMRDYQCTGLVDVHFVSRTSGGGRLFFIIVAEKGKVVKVGFFKASFRAETRASHRHKRGLSQVPAEHKEAGEEPSIPRNRQITKSG